MPVGNMLKKTAKFGIRSAAHLTEFAAVMAKHGLNITDSLLGGAKNMADAMSPSLMKGTPLKDLAFKLTKGGLDKVISFSKWVRSKAR